MLGIKIAISFDSTNIMISTENKNISYNEPALLICDAYSNNLIAIGNEAKSMYDKLPESMYYENPLKNGIVSNFNNACILLKYYFDSICSGKLFKPTVLVALSSNISSLDKKTLYDALMAAGAAKVYFISKTLADAMGTEIKSQKPQGIFVCNIDGNNTESAVISFGDIVLSESTDTGTDDMTAAVADYIYHEYDIIISQKNAEYLRDILTSAVIRNEEIAVNICGQSGETGLPVTQEITSTEIFWILKKQFENIISCIKNVLYDCPPEICGDLADNGIYLCGKGAEIYGLNNLIKQNTGLDVHITADPEQSTIKGLSEIINNDKYLIKHCSEFIISEKRNETAE